MGADPNVQDNAEWSPLHEACNRGNLSVVKVLKEFGADLNLMGFGRGNYYLNLLKSLSVSTLDPSKYLTMLLCT
jgi:ankyrin repeat protein